MNTFYIKLSTIEDIRKFVDIVTRQDYDIDLSSGRYVVDAKSIMGIFSLDLMNKILPAMKHTPVFVKLGVES